MSVAISLASWADLPGGTGGSGQLLMIPFLVLAFGFMYLIVIRPQQKRQKEWQAMLGSIKTGDRVTTAGGIRGIIVSIKDDAYVIRVAPDNIKLEVTKTAIASVTTQDVAGA
jgi:preprotein translocase subunit YajC